MQFLPLLGRDMNKSLSRAAYSGIVALAIFSPALPSLAQQPTPQTPAVTQAPTAQAAPAPAAPAPPAVVQPTQVPADAIAPVDGARPPKTAAAGLRELSPWSMFLSADILVKAVMIGLAFASLVTWTIFIAKMIELSLAQRKLRAALGKISDAQSLAEAQIALGARGNVLSALLSAAMREARLSAGISNDSGIKERAASSFAEIVRAEGACDDRRDVAIRRAVRHGVGHHEQLYRHLEIADDEPCGRGARYCRSAARHRDGPGRGDSGRHYLQSFFPRDQRLPRTGRPVVGRRRAVAVARSRSHPCEFSWQRAFARGEVADRASVTADRIPCSYL